MTKPLSSVGLLRPAILSAVMFMLLTGVAYPLVTTGAAQLLFPTQAQGSLVLRGGVTVGARVIGQAFSRPDYFQGRPSATTGSDPADPEKTVDQPYNAAASGAGNQSAASGKLLDAIAARSAAYRRANGLTGEAPVPVDAVTASASGLDPDISPANARLQAARVARARGRGIADVLALVDAHTTGRQLGVLGDARVNVLELNLALDDNRPAQSTERK